MKHPVITILGSGGGVAKAVLSVLNQSARDTGDPIHSVIANCTIHLIDCKQKDRDYFQRHCPNLERQIVLHQFDLNDAGRFKKHLKHSKTTLVVDVSWADTVTMLECCNELGIPYVNTALENTMVDENPALEGFTLISRSEIFEEHRGKFTNTTGIVGSGMNPGVVQWMALEMIGKMPGETPKACYIVEHDTTFYADPSEAEKQTVYATWSPECFLDEAILNYPMFMQRHTPLFLYSDVYEQEFKVRLGSKQFYGCLMPHEEVITLGQLYDMETGFIYRVSDYMTNLIRHHLDRVDDLWDWEKKVLDPAEAELEGEDLVGVLLVYENKERYMYNVLGSKTIFPLFQTNATYFQVACGIYGAICSMLLDELPKGVFYVDELLLQTGSRYGSYLTYYLKDFVEGENASSDGLLLDRMKSC